MAKRLNPRHQEMVRAKIQAGRILDVLQNCVDGKVILSKSQVQSAHILLSKSLSNAPELKDINLTGKIGIDVAFE